jgi:hypothetical protein
MLRLQLQSERLSRRQSRRPNPRQDASNACDRDDSRTLLRDDRRRVRPLRRDALQVQRVRHAPGLERPLRRAGLQLPRRPTNCACATSVSCFSMAAAVNELPGKACAGPCAMNSTANTIVVVSVIFMTISFSITR